MRLPNRVKPRGEADAEVARRQKQAADLAAQQAGGRGPDQADLSLRAAELEERRAKRGSDQRMHEQRMAVELEKLERTTGLKREDLMAKLGMTRMQEDRRNQRFNVETSLKTQMGQGI